MKKEARVLIVEDDPFARSWMALLLARDWRTQLAGETESLAEMPALVQAPGENVNLVLLDVMLLANTPNPDQAWESLARLPGKPQVLLVSRTPDTRTADRALDHLPFTGFCGWILKQEIRHALAWAAALAGTDTWVTTPGLEQLMRRGRKPAAGASHRLLVLDGRKSVHQLTEHEAEVARMALIFSMERRELSDEMKISPDWSYGLVSSIYHKLGMDELLSGEVDPAEVLGKSFIENSRFQETFQQALHARKKNDLESLAFHLLTMPEIREIV